MGYNHSAYMLSIEVLSHVLAIVWPTADDLNNFAILLAAVADS